MKKKLLALCTFMTLLMDGFNAFADPPPLNPSLAPHCYKVTHVYTGTGTAPTNYILPQDGVAHDWGACDSCNGELGTPNVMNYNPLFQTNGSLLFSNVVPFYQYAQQYPMSPEQVLARCTYNTVIEEAYSTNGDNSHSGCYLNCSEPGLSMGLIDAYPTAWQNVLMRVTNLATDNYFTPIWQSRTLDNSDLDKDFRDPNNYVLVKAKNLTAIKVELFIAYASTTGWADAHYSYSQPNAYIALNAPGLSQLNIGQPHYGGNWNGFYGYWPGAIGLRGNNYLRRDASCAIINATPNILFRSMTVAELSDPMNQYDEKPFTVTFNCQGGARMGNTNNRVAIGFKASATTVANAPALSLQNSQGGISHLVSDNYGQVGSAGGVGVQIYRNNQPLNLLSSENSILAGSSTTNRNNAQAMGWYPATGQDNYLVPGNNSQLTTYTEQFTARFLKLPGTEPITQGAFRSSAEIIIKVQ